MATNAAVIDTSTQNTGPTLEESHAALVKEGLITEDTDDTPTGDIDGAAAPDAAERPEWLPAKFKTAEDMAKSYSEMEKRLSGSNDDAAAGADDASNDDGAADEGTVEEVVTAAGLDFDVLAAEYATDGALSEDAYNSLEAAGIPKSLVDNYVAGLEAQNTIYENSMRSLAGGDDAYASMIEWAGENLSDDDIDAFDDAVNSGNANIASMAIRGLMAQQALDRGSPPVRQVSGKGSSESSVYESQAQVEADMNDPRYQTDEAFRQTVYRKLGRSDI